MTIEDEQNEESNNTKSFESSIPPEIIIEVFLRLRVESLLRCKSVCKLWRSLISDPHFIDSHLNLSTTNNDYARFIFLTTVPKYNLKSCPVYDAMYLNSVNPVKVDYPLENTNNFPMILGSCNGLMCILMENGILFLLNPTTRKFKRLPYCDPDTWRGSYGFGYDESSRDYKVIAIYSVRGEEKYRAKLYSLKTGNWKDIRQFPNSYSSFCACMFLNGAFHWIATSKNAPSSNRLVSFDLVNETYGEVSQPKYDDKGEGLMGMILGSVGEWLCVVSNYVGIRSDVWVMKVYGVKESWTKVTSIPYPVSDWSYLVSVPLCISDDGKFLVRFNEKLVVYNSKNKSFMEIQNIDECHIPFTFVESLVSPEPDAVTYNDDVN